MRRPVRLLHESATALALVAVLAGWACSKSQGSGGGGAGTGGSGAGGSGTGGKTSAGPADAAMSGGAAGTTQTSSPGAGGAPADAKLGAGGDSAAGGATGDASSDRGGAAGNGPMDARTGSGGTGPLDADAAAGGKNGSGGATADAATGGGQGGATGGQGGATGGAAGGSGSSAPVPSAGCGKTPPASGRATLDVSGTQREYILKVPDGYDPNHPYRLIFGFHGAQYNDDWVADGGAPLTGPFFGLESEANGGAIFVAPQASGTFSSQDLPFVDAMVAQFEAQLCVDKSRVYSVGFSMGAIMTITLACNRSDVFRAVAPMSGELPTPCPTGTHIAYWASHGSNDTTISPTLGQAARDEFVKRNHCGSQTSSPDANNCVTYQGCDAGYPVVWCTFSGKHEPAPFAGPAIWQFLSVF